MWLLEMSHTALGALRAHKLRTTLSVLGIVIGVASVVAIIAMVNGATADVKAQIAGLGMRTITITIFPQAVSSAQSSRALTEELTDELALAPSVASVAPTATSRSSVIVDGVSWDANVLGSNPEYASLFDGFYPTSGRFVHALDEGRKVAVLGAELASEYFPDAEPVGNRITLEISGEKVSFQVIGVMSSVGTVGSQNLDATIYVPLSTLQLLLGSRQFTAYIALAASDDLVEQAAEEIELVLEETLVTSSTFATMTMAGQSRGGTFAFGGTGFSSGGSTTRSPYSVVIQKEAIETYEESVSTMALILGGVGAISLLVGGIGVMNILLVSVSERTREIGTRMAIGARPAQIRVQFLVESILISLMGGLLGLGFGWLAAWLGSMFGDWPFVISVYPALLACGFSLLIGMTFGLYPALRASKMDPVEALRYE